MSVKIATCVPRQEWKLDDKLFWLEYAIGLNSCDLFLTPQEYFGGGSMREICHRRGVETDDFPVTEEWLNERVGKIAERSNTAIGVGASTIHGPGLITEDFHYYDRRGFKVGSHSKIALPAQDNIALGGASNITPETDFNRATKLVEMKDLGLRIGTVFCWQVFFNEFWCSLAAQNCNLVVHPIKFAPRAWYKKGKNQMGENTRIGFTQNKGADHPDDDSLGWIRKLKAESEFKQLPIAVTCNSWDGGEQFLALEGWVNEVEGKTHLNHVVSRGDVESVTVFEHRPELFDALPNLNDGDYGAFKDVWEHLAAKIMMRKAIKIERKTLEGKAREKQSHFERKPEVAAARTNAAFDFDALPEVPSADVAR